MKIEYSVPIFFALLAFFIASDNSQIFGFIARTSFGLPGKDSIILRLQRLGKENPEDYENFRIAQMAYCSIPVLTLSALFLTSVIGYSTYVLVLIISDAAILVVTDRSLSKKCRKKVNDIEDEFPAIVEMLTLSVGAGESPASSLKRIANRADGHLAKEFRGLVGDLERGAPLTSALDLMSQRVQSENLRRFVDSLIISISRGTPLVETLAHSANEARNRERIKLMTAAGKSEISMMIPVVFLILPISILFALFPSLTNLNLFSS